MAPSEATFRMAATVPRIYTDGTYLANNETWHSEDSPWKAKNVYEMVRRNGLNPRTLAEVGCGAGEIVRSLVRLMPETTFIGYESSAQAYEICKPKESSRLRYELSSIFEVNHTFDCLLCLDVLEHIEDYIGFARALRDKAVHKIFHLPLDVSVQSVIRSTVTQSRATVGHLHYFTRESALATLRDCGYDILEAVYTPWFAERPSYSAWAKAARIPRLALYSLAPRFAVTLMGGCSLLVLAK